MLTEEFIRERAKLVRDLAERTTDPFIRRRLLRLAEKYDPNTVPRRATPVDLQYDARGTGSER